MESGTRGYLTTGDESFLQPYLEGAKRLEPEYQALNGMVTENLPQQQQRMKEIHAGYMDWEGYASQVIAQRRAGKASHSL
jgi:two-component system chemotaxis sensor kinase CheA